VGKLDETFCALFGAEGGYMNDVAVEVVVEFSVSGVVFVGFFLVDVEAVHWVATAIGRNVIFCEAGDIVASIGKIFLGFTVPLGVQEGAFSYIDKQLKLCWGESPPGSALYVLIDSHILPFQRQQRSVGKDQSPCCTTRFPSEAQHKLQNDWR